MDESKKRTVLESILKSDKISSSYNKYRANNKLNKKLIIERIMAEIDGLWARFNDVNKLNRFLESFISNHIKDFLIPKKANDLDSIVANNSDKRVDEDPNERLKREIEERKKSKILIPINENNETEQFGNNSDNSDTRDNRENIEEFRNEENMAEKNETSNLETMMNRNNYQQMPIQHPNMMPQQHMQQQMMPQQHMQQQQQMMPPQHMQQQMMPPQHMQQQQQHMQQQMTPNMMPTQHIQQQHMQQQMNPNMMPQQNMPQQMNPNMMPPQNMQQQMPMQNPNMIPPQQHMQQQNRNFTAKPPVPTNTVNNMPTNAPAPAATIPVPPSTSIPIQQEPDRSVIHVDSRERNIVECPKSNPFSIYMNDGTTCVVCVRDLVTTNIHNDQYLLVQISENTKSVYENQLSREVHFKLVRVHKDDSCAYYKNTDMETMIRLRDINKVTFNIIRPNGKLLYSYVDDIREAANLSEEKRVEFLETNPELKDKNVEILEIVPDHLEVGDLVTVFEKDVDRGAEAKVLTIDRENNKIVLEHVDDSFTGGNKRILLNKFQISISLEII